MESPFRLGAMFGGGFGVMFGRKPDGRFDGKPDRMSEWMSDRMSDRMSDWMRGSVPKKGTGGSEPAGADGMADGRDHGSERMRRPDRPAVAAVRGTAPVGRQGTGTEWRSPAATPIAPRISPRLELHGKPGRRNRDRPSSNRPGSNRPGQSRPGQNRLRGRAR